MPRIIEYDRLCLTAITCVFRDSDDTQINHVLHRKVVAYVARFKGNIKEDWHILTKSKNSFYTTFTILNRYLTLAFSVW